MLPTKVGEQSWEHGTSSTTETRGVVDQLWEGLEVVETIEGRGLSIGVVAERPCQCTPQQKEKP